MAKLSKFSFNKFSLIEISYKDEMNGIDTYGRLVVGDGGKMKFEGDVEESARVFFEDCLKPQCERYIELLIDKIHHPLFYWKENK